MAIEKKERTGHDTAITLKLKHAVIIQIVIFMALTIGWAKGLTQEINKLHATNAVSISAPATTTTTVAGQQGK